MTNKNKCKIYSSNGYLNSSYCRVINSKEAKITEAKSVEPGVERQPHKSKRKTSARN